MTKLLQLPNEVIAIIFSRYIASLPFPLYQHRAPATLISVCRNFRDIVNDTPGLWTTVVLSERGGFRHLPEYLNRSLQMPIDVTMYPLEEGYLTTFLRRATPILQQSHRWRTVVIGMSYPWKDFRPLLPNTGNASKLESFTISTIYDRSSGPDDGRRYQAIPDYPRLRVLDISKIDLNFNDIRATQIQELDVKFKPSNGSVWGPLAAFLNRNPLLHTIRLELRGKDEDEEETESSTRLASQATRCLQVGVYPGCRLKDFLEKVEMPELRQLVIKPAQEAIFSVFGGERAYLSGVIETCIRNFGLLTEIRIKGLGVTNVKVVREDFAELASGKLDLALWIDSEKLSS